MSKNIYENLKTMTADEALMALTDHLLGSSWYCTDPLPQKYVNAIIVDEIKQMYPNYDKRHRPLKHKIRDFIYRILS